MSGIHLAKFHLSRSSAYSNLVIPAPTTVRRERSLKKSSAHGREGGAFSSLSED